MAHLLDTRDMSCYVFYGDRIFNCQPMTLTLYSGFVNEDTTIGCETYEGLSARSKANTESITHQRRRDRCGRLA